MSKTVLFKEILFSLIHCYVLFDPLIGTNQVLPLWATIGLGVMLMKGYSAFH